MTDSTKTIAPPIPGATGAAGATVIVVVNPSSATVSTLGFLATNSNAQAITLSTPPTISSETTSKSTTSSTVVAPVTTPVTSPTSTPRRDPSTETTITSSPSSADSTLSPSQQSSISSGLSSQNGTGNSTSPTPGNTGAGNSGSGNTGLIAGIAVLAAVLALALLAIVFLLLKRRRGNKQHNDFSNGNFARSNMALKENLLEAENDHPAAHASTHELQPMPPPGGLRGAASSDLSDRQIHSKFAELSRSINDWTITYYKELRQPSALSPDTMEMLQRNQPNYAMFLRGPRTKYLVIRSLVADILQEGFTTGELIGSEDFAHMRDSISNGATASEMNEWRAMTAALLAKTTWTQGERAASVQEISKRIDDMTSSLAGSPASESRLHRLTQIVDSAAGLAIDIAKQRSLVRFAKPRSGNFDAESMEDVLQENQGETIRAKPVQMVVFPAVTRYTDETSTNTNTRNVVTILKSQVLV